MCGSALQCVPERCNLLQCIEVCCKSLCAGFFHKSRSHLICRARAHLSTADTATHCTIRQHTATHCTTRQHTATHCHTLHHTAPHYNTLHLTETHCNTLHHTAPHCNTLQRTATHCNTLQHTATHFTNIRHVCTARMRVVCVNGRLREPQN